jgi:hypothetical protein
MRDLSAPQARGPVAVVGVLLATVVMLGLATWAASVGPDDVAGDGPGHDERTLPTPTHSDTSTGERVEPDPRDLPSETPTLPLWVRLLGRTLVAAAVLLLAYAVVRRLVDLARTWRGRRLRSPREPPPPDEPFDVLASARPTAEALLRDADDQRALLMTGTPRNAIVACWHRFELQAEVTGVPRRKHETPAEFTLRLLDLVDADHHAVLVLADLYREARFSDHELDESARERALAALGTLHRDLAERWVRGGV